MKKIVIDARELRTSTGRYIEKLLQYLQELDKENSYQVLLKPNDLEDWKPTNPKFHKVACPYKEFTFAEQIDLLRQIRKLQPDLVHFGMVQQPVLYMGKVVTTMHDLTTVRFANPSKNWLVFRFKQMVYKRVNKWAARKSSRVITPTEFVKNDVARFAHINSRKIVVTPEAADKITEPAEPMPELMDKEFIMYVGRPTPHKNLDKLVEAFALTKASRPGLSLVLAGKKDANYRRLESRVKRLGVQDVVFTSFISDGQLRWLYEHTTAYVFPSLSEGFGLPGLEAMVHGAPVISSNATCLPEVYGEAAQYFDPLDVDDIAKQISRVLASSKLRQDLIAKGHKQAGKYSWRRMAEQTLEIYKEVLGE